jgi:ABC-type spermidine/putrescine transport system permease subunit II
VVWRPVSQPGLIDAAWVTLIVGVVSATVATVLGTMAALALTRYTRFRGRVLFSGMVFAPLVMPEVITGLSLLLLFVAIGSTAASDGHLATSPSPCASSPWSSSRG